MLISFLPFSCVYVIYYICLYQHLNWNHTASIMLLDFNIKNIDSVKSYLHAINL